MPSGKCSYFFFTWNLAQTFAISIICIVHYLEKLVWRSQTGLPSYSWEGKVHLITSHLVSAQLDCSIRVFLVYDQLACTVLYSVIILFIHMIHDVIYICDDTNCYAKATRPFPSPSRVKGRLATPDNSHYYVVILKDVANQ